MNVNQNQELASIESDIKRSIALIEMCEKWNAGEEAIEEARKQLQGHLNAKAELLGTTVRRDTKHQEAKQALFAKVYEALDS